MYRHGLGQASLATALLVALIAALLLGWRWFAANGDRLSEWIDTHWRRLLASPRWRRLAARHPRFWTFVAARFARGEYLGLHLTVGLAISLLALGIFGAITEDVINHDPLTEFDVDLLDWFHRHATPAGYRISETISFFGATPAVTVLALGMAVLLAVRQRWILLGGWLATLVGTGVLDQGLKLVIRRPRPPYAADILPSFSWSFPSGHAMGSLVVYGMLAYLVVILWAHRRAARIWVLTAAAILVVGIGLSRLYLGVHYFSDVAAGYAVGMLWLSGCVSGLEVARRWGVRSAPRAG